MVISFFNPLIGITGWLFSEIFLGNYQIFGANPRTYIAFVLGFYFLIRELLIYKGENLKRIFAFIKIPLSILILGITINVFLNTSLNNYFRWVVTFLSNIATVIFIGLAIRNERSLRKVVNIFIFLLAINALVGIFQYIGIEQAYAIRQSIAKIEIHAHQGRVLGLSRNCIKYSYVLLLGITLLLGMLFWQDKERKKERMFLYISIWLIGLALILNGTRSAIGGILISVLFYTFFDKKILGEKVYTAKRIFTIFFIIFVLAFTTFFVLEMFGLKYVLSPQQIFLRDFSAIGRIPRVKLAIEVLSHNILGVGGMWNYVEKISSYWSNIGLTKGISFKSFSSHNHFLSAFIYYGIIGGILFIIYMLKLLKSCVVHYRNTSSTYLKGIFLGGGLFIAAYCVNIFFHNYGPLDGDNLVWFFIGIITASVNIEKERNNNLDRY